MVGWVGLQQQAGRAPRLLVVDVRQPRPGAGLEFLPVHQRRMHLLVAAERVWMSSVIDAIYPRVFSGPTADVAARVTTSRR